MAYHLAVTAKVLRRHIMSHEYKFNGSFDEGCDTDPVPASLLEFVSMVGSNTKPQLDSGVSKLGLLSHSCWHMIALSDINEEGASSHRLSKGRESPFAIFEGLWVCTKQ